MVVSQGSSTDERRLGHRLVRCHDHGRSGSLPGRIARRHRRSLFSRRAFRRDPGAAEVPRTRGAPRLSASFPCRPSFAANRLRRSFSSPDLPASLVMWHSVPTGAASWRRATAWYGSGQTANGAEVLTIPLKDNRPNRLNWCCFSPDGHEIWFGLDEKGKLWGWDATPLENEAAAP